MAVRSGAESIRPCHREKWGRGPPLFSRRIESGNKCNKSHSFLYTPKYLTLHPRPRPRQLEIIIEISGLGNSQVVRMEILSGFG